MLTITRTGMYYDPPGTVHDPFDSSEIWGEPAVFVFDPNEPPSPESSRKPYLSDSAIRLADFTTPPDLRKEA